jgi:hypothetical protein
LHINIADAVAFYWNSFCLCSSCCDISGVAP